MMQSRFFPLILLVVIVGISCQSEYTQTVKQELKTGIVHDSLILGMYMGQTQKEFYAHCWDLNKNKLISQGTGNRYAKFYDIPDSTEDPLLKMEVLFYGIFDEDKVMRGMDMKYSFTAWAPWNEDLHSDPLIEYLKGKYMKDYPGNDFLTVESENLNTDVFAKVDGNRQILIYPIDNKEVSVKIEDLRYKIK